MRRWLDYWIQFDDRPFVPGEEKITWEYIYDNKETPTEIMILIKVEDKAGNTKIFAPPISNGKFMDYPPQITNAVTDLENGFLPLQITAESKDQWGSIENGVPVRRGSDDKILERLNMQTAQWEELSKAEVALQDAEMQFKDLGVQLSSKDYTLTQDENGVVTVVDNNRKAEIYKDSNFDYNYLLKQTAKICEITNLANVHGTHRPKDFKGTTGYADGVLNEAQYKEYHGPRRLIPITNTNYCWIIVDDLNTLFRDKNGIVHVVAFTNLNK